MKKILAIFLTSFLVIDFAGAASSTIDLSSGPAKETKEEAKAEEADARSRSVKSDAKLYYSSKKRIETTEQAFSGCTDEGCSNIARSVRSESWKAESVKKYNLSNPFFQPRQGEFAGVLDLTYTSSSMEFDILPGSGLWANNSGEYGADSMYATANLSYGVTDDVTVLASGRFADTDLEIKWDQAIVDDKDSDSKIDSWGLGVQWRFLNNSQWIGNALISYQSLTDAAKVAAGELKAGYKDGTMTYYGFLRGYYMDWKGDGYGIGLENQYNQAVYFVLEDNAKNSIYYDLGVGLFSAIDSDWSVDTQLAYSDAEWHQTVSAQVGISYQPWKNVALSLNGRASLWDNADEIDDSAVWFQQNDGSVYRTGTAKLGEYSEYSIGTRVAVLF